MSRVLLLLLVVVGTPGCGSEPRPAVSAPSGGTTPPDEKRSEFRPAVCGDVIGSVTWTGAAPVVPQVVDIHPRPDGTGSDVRSMPNPYAPDIDRATHALRGAVVYLRNVDPARAKPWDVPPVRIELRDARIVVTHGDRVPGRVGFVRRGAAVSFKSCEPTFNVLRGRGAAFFALPFPDADAPLERAFDTPGRIALTSAAGFPWQVADLFVCDHPYYALSGADGRFEFTQVPEGAYELIAWHPNWTVAANERNPETGLVQRVVFAPPIETARAVTVTPGRATFAPVNLSAPK